MEGRDIMRENDYVVSAAEKQIQLLSQKIEQELSLPAERVCMEKVREYQNSIAELDERANEKSAEELEAKLQLIRLKVSLKSKNCTACATTEKSARPSKFELIRKVAVCACLVLSAALLAASILVVSVGGFGNKKNDTAMVYEIDESGQIRIFFKESVATGAPSEDYHVKLVYGNADLIIDVVDQTNESAPDTYDAIVLNNSNRFYIVGTNGTYQGIGYFGGTKYVITYPEYDELVGMILTMQSKS